MDSLEITADIVGEWRFDYYVNLEVDGSKDTFYLKWDSLQIQFGLAITQVDVCEFIKGTEASSDTTIYQDKGSWEIDHEKNGFWIRFDCGGIILCGVYEIILVRPNEMVLKSCSKYQDEGCQLTHLIRI